MGKAPSGNNRSTEVVIYSGVTANNNRTVPGTEVANPVPGDRPALGANIRNLPSSFLDGRRLPSRAA